jgi:hypothetical protein
LCFSVPAAIQIKETIKNIELSDSNTFAAIFGELCFYWVPQVSLQKYKVQLILFGFKIKTQ